MSEQESQLAADDAFPDMQLLGFWKIWWMFWMQPTLFRRRLQECGVDPDTSILDLSWSASSQLNTIRYYVSLTTMLIIGMPTISLSTASIVDAFGGSINYNAVVIGIAIGAAIGIVVVVAFSVATGVALGVAVGVVLGVALGVAFGTAFDGLMSIAFGAGVDVSEGVKAGLTFGGVFGAVLGLIGGVAGRVSSKYALGRVYPVAFGGKRGGVFGVVLSVVFGVMIGVAGGFARGVVSGIMFAFAFSQTFDFGAGIGSDRLPLLPIEIIISLSSRMLSRLFGGSPLRFSPALWHELCLFPLPGLQQRMLDEAPRDPAFVRMVLDACWRSEGQRKIAETVQESLKARECKQLIMSRDFANASELRGEWLGGGREADARIQSLAEASRYLRSASMAVVARHRRHQVEQAQETLRSLRNLLLTNNSRGVLEFQLALDAAESVATEMHREAQALAAGQLANPFRAGDPLNPEFDQTTFRGRDDLVRQIELLLNDERQAAAVSVIAPRRCGKSSLLRMLPVKLPDALCVFFDLQDNPIQAPLDLFPALEKRLREQARPQERESLPRLRDSSLEAARDWLEELEQRPGRDRVLFCLDEFERLEEVVGEKPETKQQLVQLMGLLRATIQHRRRVRLLVAGNSTFEELGPLWNDSFISARELRLGPLAREVAIGLLRQPIPVSEGFPDDAVPQEVAEAIVDRTGGQPYLTQLYGFWLVEELNKTKRHRAELKDVETVDQIVFEQAAPFFRDSLNPRGATFAVRPVIEQIVAGRTPELTGNQSRFLLRRGLITVAGTLAFPILGRWLNESAE